MICNNNFGDSKMCIRDRSLGVMQKYTLFDKGFFDLLDFVTAKIMLPLGGMLVRCV